MGVVEQLLYDAAMQLKTSAGAVADVAVDEILRAAGVIYSLRRKTHGGPTRVYRCRWCDGEQRGRKLLDQHERSCSARPSGDLEGVSAADLTAWTPPDAA